jgi:hypothetical protein
MTRQFKYFLHQAPNVSPDIVMFIGGNSRVIYEMDDWLIVETDQGSTHSYCIISPYPKRTVPWCAVCPSLPDQAIEYINTRRLIKCL